jgi:CHAT domain-containing protein
MKVLLTAILSFFLFNLSFGQSWKELKDSTGYYYNSNNYEKAILFGEKTLIATKEELGENHPDYATSLNDLAFLYSSMGKYEKAELLYIQAKEIRKKVLGEDHLHYSISLNNLAGLYERMGLLNKAEPLYIQAKEIRKKVLGENDPDYAVVLDNLASLYTNMGQYEKAEPLYIEAKEIKKKSLGETHRYYAISLNNLATLYTKIGQYEKAEPLYKSSMEIIRQLAGESNPDYANSLVGLAALYERMGQYKKAEPMYMQAMEIDKKIFGEIHPYYAIDLNNLAFLYADMGQYEKVEPLYIRSMDIVRQLVGESHPDYALRLNNLALLYNIMGEYEKTETLFIRSMDIRKQTLGEAHPLYAKNLNSLAFFYTNQGEYEKAEPLFIKASSIIRKNLLRLFNVLSEKEKSNYLSNNINLNSISNIFLYKHRLASPLFYKESFDLQLLLKSISLANTKMMLESVRSSKDTNVQKIFSQWQSNKSMLSKQYVLSIGKRMENLAQIEEKSEMLEKELTRISSDFREQQRALQIKTGDVVNRLSDDEAVIEFVSFEYYNKKPTDSTIYAAYILTKKDSVPHFVPLFEEKQFQQLQQILGGTGKITEKSANVFYPDLTQKDKNTKQGEALYKLIWQPLEPYLAGIKKISYSPAGKLFGIAFHALFIGNDSLLIEKYQLQQYTSTRQVALRNTESQTVKPTNITLFGNANFSMDSLQLTKQRTDLSGSYVSRSIYTPPLRGANNNSWPSLPGTAEEVNSIKQLFDRNKIATRSFAHTTASEENLKALSGNSPQILHIATHGFFLPEPNKEKKDKTLNQGSAYTLADDPLLRTGLILSGGNYAWSGKEPIAGVEDGIVTAYEIAQLNLSNTELVVLSACETALGDVKGSEGVFGLQRAFRMAGVKKMLVSLWKIPDRETAELMTSFYTYWMKGETINDAFTQAQADMRKKYSPFYWAAFVLVE